jgi:hypothetical protein
MDSNSLRKRKLPRKPWDTSKAAEDQDSVFNLVEFSRARERCTLGRHVEGYLQFKVYDFLMESEERIGFGPVRTITDAWGQEHELFYKRGVPLSA